MTRRSGSGRSTRAANGSAGSASRGLSLKLLIDEQYTGLIAARLRDGGHDVVTVGERGWSGLDDEPLLERATDDRRAILTNNVRHFMPLFGSWAQQGREHDGMVFTDDARMPRSRGAIGLYVQTLDSFLAARPGDEALLNAIHWLP